MDKENFRFYIKVRTALNIQARIIYEELHSVFGDQAPGLRTVERWSQLFRQGREDIEDEARSGRPITETTFEKKKKRKKKNRENNNKITYIQHKIISHNNQATCYKTEFSRKFIIMILV
jgi:hypothetical protein